MDKLVSIKEKYCKPDEGKVLYVVVEDNGERLFITPLEWKYSIKPVELVRRHMLEGI